MKVMGPVTHKSRGFFLLNPAGWMNGGFALKSLSVEFLFFFCFTCFFYFIIKRRSLDLKKHSFWRAMVHDFIIDLSSIKKASTQSKVALSWYFRAKVIDYSVISANAKLLRVDFGRAEIIRHMLLSARNKNAFIMG